MLRALAFLVGLLLPLGVLAGGLALLVPSPMAATGLVALGAALAVVRPPGGAMGVDGTTRLRFCAWGWTLDARRGRGLGALAAFAVPAVVLVGFLGPSLPLALLWRLTGPHAAVWDQRLLLASTFGLLALALLRHRRELPLARWRRLAEGGEVDLPTLGRWTRLLSRIVQADGSIGHVGGIGADVVGLHELLDAEAILRLASRAGVAEAAALHRALLAHLGTREVEGGFPIYPGGLPRASFTQAARRALEGG